MGFKKLFTLMVALAVFATVLLASCVNEADKKINIAKTQIIDKEETVPFLVIADTEEIVVG